MNRPLATIAFAAFAVAMLHATADASQSFVVKRGQPSVVADVSASILWVADRAGEPSVETDQPTTMQAASASLQNARDAFFASETSEEVCVRFCLVRSDGEPVSIQQRVFRPPR